MPSKEPSRTKANAAIARQYGGAAQAAQELLEQIAAGNAPMTAEQINVELGAALMVAS